MPAVALIATAVSGLTVVAGSPAQSPSAAVRELRPTAHVTLPTAIDGYWIVPPDSWRPGPPDGLAAARDLAQAGDLISLDKAARALTSIRLAALKPTPLYHYGLYKKGLAELALERYGQARATFGGLRVLSPVGALSELAAMKEAEADEGLQDFAAAVAIYDVVLTHKPAVPDIVTLSLARAARNAGDEAGAIKAFEQVYYEWPTTESGDAAALALAAVRREPIASGSQRFIRELARAERLYAGRRYSSARDNFALLLPHAGGDSAEQIRLRLAECEYFLRRYQRALDGFTPLLKSGARLAEVRYFSMMASKGLGATDEFVRQARRLAEQFPDSVWADDALDSLASYWIVADKDDKADEVFHDLMSRFPEGRHIDRARWKVGWYAYRHRRFADSASVFDEAAAASPRSDYRPSWLYWAAKSHDNLANRETANARFALTVADYANTYYGELATKVLKARHVPVPSGDEAARRFVTPPAPAEAPIKPEAITLVRWLIAVEMYDEAFDEVQYAERNGGASRELRATRAWLFGRRGDFRQAITLMRQVYPQVLAAGGETIPGDVQKIIFPLDYWPIIRQYAALHNMDPFLMAALIAQESAFDPNVKSAANAIGLMQVLPSTGRRYARVLGMRGFTPSQLTTPETNIRIGSSIFADLVQRFGAVHVALCGYNAGDTRAAQWAAEREGLPLDEWIDDIPFPETQTYVRRILGTAENYRRLYGK